MDIFNAEYHYIFPIERAAHDQTVYGANSFGAFVWIFLTLENTNP